MAVIRQPNRFTRTRSRPVNPGGPFVPRPDLGPGVGYGVGLPQPQPSPIRTVRQVLNQPGVKQTLGTLPNVFNTLTNQIAQSSNPQTQQMGQFLQGIGEVTQPILSNVSNAIGNQIGIGGKSNPAQPGGPFVPRPDLGPGVGYGVGLPQPSPIDTVQQVLNQPGIQQTIGAGSNIAGGMVNQLTQSQDPNAQAIGNVLSGIGGIAQPVVGAIGNQIGIGGKSNPAQPGGPFVPRPDLGPGVGFGVGLPHPETQLGSEAMPYDGMGLYNQPNYVPTQATQQNPNVSIGFGGKSAPSKLPGNF